MKLRKISLTFITVLFSISFSATEVPENLNIMLYNIFNDVEYGDSLRVKNFLQAYRRAEAGYSCFAGAGGD